MNTNKQDQEEQFMKKLENSSPEEARNLIIQSFPSACQGIGSNFFNCLEDNIKVFEGKNIDMVQMEKEFNDNITPKCMKQFNLEDCLKQFGPSH